MRISDWSSDVCSSDLSLPQRKPDPAPLRRAAELLGVAMAAVTYVGDSEVDAATAAAVGVPFLLFTEGYRKTPVEALRSEEHTSELQSLMRSSYAVFCLKKKKEHEQKPLPQYIKQSHIK